MLNDAVPRLCEDHAHRAEEALDDEDDDNDARRPGGDSHTHTHEHVER